VSNYRYIQAISRAADILELVGNSPDGLTLTQIAGTRGLPKQTTYNILRTLVHKEMLEKGSHPRRYRLGPVMVGMRKKQDRWSRNLLARAVPLAIRVSKKTRGEVVICQFTGGEVIGRLRVPAGPSGQPVMCYSWLMRPYGTGLVFQAYLGAAVVQEYRRVHPLDGDPASLDFWGSYELVDRLLALIRSEGYLAYVKSRILRVVAPVLAGTGSIEAAVSLFKTPVADISACRARECIEAVRDAAGQLSSSLSDCQRADLPARVAQTSVQCSGAPAPRAEPGVRAAVWSGHSRT